MRNERGLERSEHRRPQWRRWAVALGIAASLASPPTHATNLFFNPEFDENVVGWTASGAGVLWDPLDRNACSRSGSAFGTGISILGTPYIALLPQCIPVASGETISVRVEARVVFASQPVTSTILVHFVTGGCEDPPASTITANFGAVPFNTWTRQATTFTVPDAMTGALVFFQLRSTAAFDVLWDRAYASGPEFEIYADGFELGEACRWSAVRSPG